jgi:hypothetical protein
LPELPAGVSVRHADLPPAEAVMAATDRKGVYEAVRADKGRRIAAGLGSVQPDDLVMIVDDDDLIHRGLVAFATTQTRRCGWVIDRGYLWRTGSRFMTLTDRFSEKCGTSLLIPPDYFLQFSGTPDTTEAIRELGSHQVIFERLPFGPPTWARVPFAAAIYRLERSGYSRSQEIVTARSRSPVPRFHRTGMFRLVPPRLLTSRIRRDFFGNVAGA